MKKICLAALAVVTISAVVYANVGASEEATNCTYTGNSSDYCNASDGTRNLKVQNCKPGSTDCSY
jgi:hypothetical protein